MTGTVKFYQLDKGWGIVTGTDGQEAFLHCSQLRDRNAVLVAGDRVEYRTVSNPKGLTAKEVKVLGHGHTAHFGTDERGWKREKYSI